MAVYRCNKCGLIAEENTLVESGKMPCASCAAQVTLFPAAFYLTKLFERYEAIRRELEALRRQEDGADEDQAQDAEEKATPEIHTILRDSLQNTLLLATPEQHKPLEEWFANRNITTQCDYNQVDTSGFFDEGATLIGDNFSLLDNTLDRLRFAYSKGGAWLNIDLGSFSNKETQQLKAILRQLYSYTFFSKYVFQKQKNTIGVGLQPAPPIQGFLTGSWLEWWAFIRLLEFCLEYKIIFSCARGMVIEFPDQEKRELDVVFLLQKDGRDYPVIVECKTGEFRTELEKYSKLRKRLKLEQSQFLICNPLLVDEQAAALGAMYGLSFTNLENFGTHLGAMLNPGA